MLTLGPVTTIGVAIGCILLVAAVVALLTRSDKGRSKAFLRLDWFVPFLRKLQAGQAASHSLIGRMWRQLLPAALQSDRTTKQRGTVRKTLRWIGLSWLASPVRRVVQTVCLLTFLFLFFYVCWPYHASPKPSGQISSGWTFKEIDQVTGKIHLGGKTKSPAKLAAGATIYVFDESATELKAGALGAFQVASILETSIQLESYGALTPELLDAFFTSTGPWALHETDPTAWPSHYADDLARKEKIPAETFLILDPLVSLSTAVASRSWVWSLVSAAIILLICVIIPRGFCGYLCPLGTTIDFFDWAIAGRVKRFRVPDDGWWVHIKYFLLAGTMVCAVFGVLVSGFFAAIPVITRGMLFLLEPLQSGALRGWHLVPAMNAGHYVSLLLFLAVLCLGFLQPRFWC